jgi:hypothetical protein
LGVDPKRVFSIGLILGILLIGFAASAKSTAGDYTLSVSGKGVAVQISGDLLQGVPDPPAINSSDPFGNIPIFKLHLDNANASSFTTVLNAALREKTSTPSLDHVVLDASSNGTFYHYNLGFDVNGISADHGDTIVVDLSWRSFVMRDDFKIGDYSVNAIVLTYLEGKILQLAQMTSTPLNTPGIQHSLRWWWNGRIADRHQVGALSAAASMFNFTSLGLPLDKWRTTADSGREVMTYQTTSGFNLTFADQISEIGETATFWTNAVYNLKATITAPWGTVAAGDTLIFDTQTPWSIWLMLTAIAATVGLVVGSDLFERHLRGFPRLRSKGKRSQK